MFVRRRKYDELMSDNIGLMSDKNSLEAYVLGLRIDKRDLQVEYEALKDRYFEMLQELAEANVRSSGPRSSQFSGPEIKTLINLCHPDKHGGKKSATDITAKLLGMR